MLEPMATNPFGKWTTHRARIAGMNRPDADKGGMEAAQQSLAAARLWDQIDRVAESLTPEQRRLLRKRLGDNP